MLPWVTDKIVRNSFSSSLSILRKKERSKSIEKGVKLFGKRDLLFGKHHIHGRRTPPLINSKSQVADAK